MTLLFCTASISFANTIEIGEVKDLKRFVTYIYEYDRGIRGRNTGFVRTDIRDTLCQMELHIRGLDRYKGKVPVYLTVAEDTPLGIPVGEILISQGMGSLVLSFPNLQIGPSPYSINQLQALVISLGNGRLLAGCFVKEPAEGILNGSFSNWTPVPAVPEEPGTSDSETVHSPHNYVSPVDSSPENDISSKNTTPPRNENPAISAASLKMTDSSRSSVSKDSTVAAESASPEPEISSRRIELTDIRSLPRRNWYLSNNRFVVHGFFNYHYLILKTVMLPNGRKRYLGVPGIYEQPERMMALLFGFPDFELSEEAKKSRSQNDADMTGAFGYWMCPIAEE